MIVTWSALVAPNYNILYRIWERKFCRIFRERDAIWFKIEN